MAAELHGEDAVAWGAHEYLLANVIDLLAALDHHFLSANTPKGKARPPVPKPFPRPGAPRARHRSTLPPAEVARRLKEMRARHGS